MRWLFLFVVFSASYTNAWEALLDKNLSHWNKYLGTPGKHSQLENWPKDKEGNYTKPLGHNHDPLNVFTLKETSEGLLLHVSGEAYGSVYTKKDYQNYHLKLQVKWGSKKYPPREDLELDTGILYHGNGEHGIDYWKAWQQSQELQIMEKSFGDYWSIAGSMIDIACVTPAAEQFPIYKKGSPFIPFHSGNNFCRRGADLEILNDWNSVELISVGDKSLHIVNGQVVMALRNSRHLVDGKEVPLTKGRILLQSEAGEAWFRDVMIRSIDEIPEEYKSYF